MHDPRKIVAEEETSMGRKATLVNATGIELNDSSIMLVVYDLEENEVGGFKQRERRWALRVSTPSEMTGPDRFSGVVSTQLTKIEP